MPTSSAASHVPAPRPLQILPQPFVVRPQLPVVLREAMVVLRQPSVRRFQLQHELHSSQVQPFIQERPDPTQRGEVVLAVSTCAAVRAAWGEQALAFILADVLLARANELRRDGDRVDPAGVPATIRADGRSGVPNPPSCPPAELSKAAIRNLSKNLSKPTCTTLSPVL